MTIDQKSIEHDVYVGTTLSLSLFSWVECWKGAYQRVSLYVIPLVAQVFVPVALLVWHGFSPAGISLLGAGFSVL